MDMHPAPTDLPPAHRDAAERALRQQLADCYHLVDFFGWTETIFNHISARLPGTDHYLVNPFGLNYDEITPTNLIKVDVNGQKVEDSPYDGNPAGFALHGAIHAAREDIPRPSLGQELALSEAPDPAEGHFRVPKVL